MIDETLFSMLITQIWQVALLAIVVWVATKVFAKNRPHLSHALWILVLVKCIMPPIWSCPTSPFSWLGAGNAESNSVAFATLVDPVFEPPKFEQSDSENATLFPQVIVQAVPIDEFEQREVFADAADQMNLISRAESWVNKIDAFTMPVSGIESNSQIPMSWSVGLCWFWVVGVAISFCIALIRSLAFLCWIKRSSEVDQPELVSLLNQLRGRLGIKRNVRVRVLKSPVGPAVLGVLKPTILLPESVVANKTESELEPLLAHELIHIRRGDLWWALVQTLARNLFWFHPLVWVADRMVTRESERSCDEETVACLGCPPAVYARSLLEVLEQKHRLRVAPALPGIRAVDITSARLERVMKLRTDENKINKRTPVWTWLVMLACSVMVLPGAAMVLAQQASEPVQQNETQADNTEVGVAQEKITPPTAYYLRDDVQYFPKGPEFKLSQEAAALKAARTKQGTSQAVDQTSRPLAEEPNLENSQWIYRTFDVSKVLDAIRAAKLNLHSPEKRLILELPCRYPGKNGKSTPVGRDVRVVVDGEEIQLGGDSQTMKIINGKLHVYEAKPIMRMVEEGVTRLNESLFKQIVIESRMVTTPSENLKNIGFDWSVGHSAVFRRGGPESAIETKGSVGVIPSTFNSGMQVRAASYVEKSSPVVFAFIDKADVQKLIQQSKGDTKTNITQAPTVTMFSGSEGQIMDGVTRPFIVGLTRLKDENGKLIDSFQPIVRLVNDGTMVKFKATSKSDESVDLDCLIDNSTILSVGQADVPIKLKSGSACIQIPEVSTSQIQSSVNIPKDKTLALGSFRQNKDGKQEAYVVMLRCVTLQTVQETPDVLWTPQAISLERAREITGNAKAFVQVVTEDGKVNFQGIPSQPEVFEFEQPKIEANEFAPKVPIEEVNRVEILIHSTQPADGKTDYRPLMEIFDQNNHKAKIEGHVDYEIVDDRVVISGKNLTFDAEPSSEESEFKITGENARIEFSKLGLDGGTCRLEFEGDVKFSMAEQELTADKIVYGAIDDDPLLLLSGNAKIHTEICEAVADEIDFGNLEDGVLVLRGNATLELADPKTNISADQIWWNGETGEIKANDTK